MQIYNYIQVFDTELIQFDTDVFQVVKESLHFLHNSGTPISDS